MENTELFKKAYAEVITTNRKAAAELIVEYVDPNHITQDIVGMFLDTRTLKPGDALVKKVRRGIEVKQMVPGQTGLSTQITVKDIVNYNIDAAIVEVQANEWEVQKGEIGTVDSIRREMLAKLSDFYCAKVMNALYGLATIDNSVNFYYMTRPITRSVLEDAIDLIADTAGSVRAVVGRRTALAPITKFAGYRVAYGATETTAPLAPIPSALEEIRRTGWFGQYYGANFIALEQIYDNPFDRNKLIRDDLIVVIGKSCGEFINYGPVVTEEWTDFSTAPPTWHVRIYQQYGFIFDKMENVVVIRLDQ